MLIISFILGTLLSDSGGVTAGREINFFFSDSHLAPKFFKVVANLKKSWSPFSKTDKTLFYAVSVLDRPSKIRLGKRSLTHYKVDIRMDDMQRSSSPKSKMAIEFQVRRFGSKLNGEVCRGFIFANLF